MAVQLAPDVVRLEFRVVKRLVTDPLERISEGTQRFWEALAAWHAKKAEAAVKDQEEIRLHQEVCAGRMTLDAAQEEMRRRWLAPLNDHEGD